MDDKCKQIQGAGIKAIHDSTVNILAKVGFKFNNQKAIDVLKKKGIKTIDDTVFFSEKDIFTAFETVPAKFTIEGRNNNNIIVGGEQFLLVPGCGATKIIGPDGEQRDGSIQDFKNLCKLVQTSKHLDCIGTLLIHPAELPAETSHLDAMHYTMTLCDKVPVVSTASEYAAFDAINMGKMIYNEAKNPVMIGMISSLPPLQFGASSTQSLIEFAKAGQAVTINASSIMGLTAPITMAGAQVIQNAAFIAGMCLSQIVNPGTPVIYGISGAPMNMRTSSPSYGSPELAKSLFIGSQLARFYNVPCRGGGAFTDTFIPDIQAGMESAFILSSAAMSGMDMSICACGMLGSYLGMSFEKFIVDEQLCGMVKKLLAPVSFSSDDICLDLIEKVGIGGNYLVEPHTVERCRTEFFMPHISNKANNIENQSFNQAATQEVTKRLKGYEMPELDRETQSELDAYIKKRKKQIMKS